MKKLMLALMLIIIPQSYATTTMSYSPGSASLNFLSSPPSDISLHSIESNSAYTAYKEVEGFVLPEDFVMDLGPEDLGGTYGGGLPSTGSRTIAQGTVVDVYYIQLDPVGSNFVSASGTFTINGGEILGFIGHGTTHELINNTMSAQTGTTYDNQRFALHSGDKLTYTSSTQFTLDNAASSGRDPLRVFVQSQAAVPEPSSLALLALSLLGIAFLRRK